MTPYQSFLISVSPQPPDGDIICIDGHPLPNIGRVGNGLTLDISGEPWVTGPHPPYVMLNGVPGGIAIVLVFRCDDLGTMVIVDKGGPVIMGRLVREVPACGPNGTIVCEQRVWLHGLGHTDLHGQLKKAVKYTRTWDAICISTANVKSEWVITATRGWPTNPDVVDNPWEPTYLCRWEDAHWAFARM